MCSHPGREQLEAALIDGDNISSIARRFAVSSDAVYRHTRRHFSAAAREAMTGPAGLAPSDVAARVLAVADAARDLRLTSATSGRRGDAVRSMSVELKALETLSDRFGIENSDVLAEIAQLSTLATSLARLMRRDPTVATALASELRDDGHSDLAEEIESVAVAQTQIGMN